MITPYYRYRTSSLNLASGTYNPSFPTQAGLSVHSYGTEKPKYTITNRLYGTSRFNWRSENVKQDDRATIYAFWNSTLATGYNDFTVIDNRSRLLFEATWNNWKENWKKLRGGLHDINYDIESSVPWTPPVWGAYLFQDDTGNNFTLQGDNMTITGGNDGQLVNKDTALHPILRQNGSALTMTADATKIQQSATVAVDWQSSSQKKSWGMFCQAMTSADLGVGRIYFMEMFSGANNVRLYIDSPDAIKAIYNSTIIGINTTMDNTTWYDLCFTYDGVKRQLYLYGTASATGTTFTPFLEGLNTIGDQLATSETVVDIDKWDTASLITESFATSLPSEASAYVQNCMFFDGFVTPFDFNNLRRLCYMWNGKTTVEPK